jgi:prevent-host-death family protein
MNKRYSIAEARDHLSELVHEAEADGPVTLTRRGRPVAVVVAQEEYQRLRDTRPGFWDGTLAFRASVDLSELAVDDVFRDVRDRAVGRSVHPLRLVP